MAIKMANNCISIPYASLLVGVIKLKTNKEKGGSKKRIENFDPLFEVFVSDE
jgi:hypothetical protein